jgi:hypothetical protein
MNWRTELHISKNEFSISHGDYILGLGSCFAENIGRKLEYSGFGSMNNPTGILFNSSSICKMLELLLAKVELDKERFVNRDGMVCHYDFHFDFRAKSKEEFLNFWARAQKAFIKTWEETTVLTITLGTANVYEMPTGIVANCHKQSKDLFSKRVLSISEIQKDIERITHLAEAKKTIFTVSPVRHLKDGFIENQVSKAHLISAIHQTEVTYFPSYELVIDDLRDYRFYKEDNVHPSEEAINYIWKKFGEAYFSEETKEKIKKVDKLRKMQNHKAFNPLSKENENLKKTIQTIAENLKMELPYLKV